MSRQGIKMSCQIMSPLSRGSSVYCPALSRFKATYPLPHDRFRESLGLTNRLNETKVFREYPDFTFVDGRPTPVTPKQLKQIKWQRALAESAVKHLKEIKFIEDRYNNKIKSAQAEKQQIVASKLKPKGDALLELKK